MAIMQFEKKTINSVKKGDFSLFTKTVSEGDVTLYAGISADFSPLHMNEEYASETEFGRRVAHPMLIGSMAGGAIYRLLSPGAYPIKREFQMLAPVYMGETITVRAEIEAIHLEQQTVVVAFECYNQKSEPVMRGVSEEWMYMKEEEA